MTKLTLTQTLKLITVIGFALLIISLAKLQLFEGEKYREYAVNNYVKKSRLEANRGEIYDRNGLPIAQNYPAINLALIPGFISNKDSLKTYLASCSNITSEELDKFLYDTRFRQYQENNIVDNLSQEQVAKLAESLNYFPELRFTISNTRKYHFPNHFTGYIGRINQEEYATLKDNGYHFNSYLGKTGIEKQYEEVLKGIDGVKLNLVDARGRNLDLFNRADYRRNHINIPPVHGMDLHLTIDLPLQQFIDDTFPDEMQGAVVVMDYETGEVLAYVSRPEFDQNIFMSRIPTTTWEAIQADTTKPLLDRVSKAVYPPGSVFKTVTAGFGLEKKLVSRWTNLAFCAGGLQIGDRYVKCWNEYGHGTSNAIEALQISCDVYFYDLSFRINLDDFWHYVKDNMLSERTGIDVPNEAKGFFPNSNWYYKTYGKYTSIRGQMVNLSIGQGEMFMTPLQICALYSGMANEGLWMKPHLLKQATRGDSTLTFSNFTDNLSVQLPYSSENLKIVNEGLRKVITEQDGTAHRLHRANRRIYGKTGSAEHKKDRVTHAWFAGFDKDSKIAVTVFCQEGGGGGSVAAPIAGKIFEYYYDSMRGDNVQN